MSAFLDQDLTLESYWRAVILFGQNVASYKFALAKSLIEFSNAGKSAVSLEELAEPFSRHVVEHLATAPKQATSASSHFLEACRACAAGTLSREALIGQTVKLGFQNVIDAFHVVNRDEIPVRFFEDARKNSGGIVLTDQLFHLRDGLQFGNLPQEVEARWRLVETAWQLRITRSALAVDVDDGSLVISNAGRRTVLTGCRDALNGYQKGKCFYCFKDISIESASDSLADVDHFFPRVLMVSGMRLPLDGIWNLVLACRDCNRGIDGKSCRAPHNRLLERLDTRNEFLISSHHPLRETLMLQMGETGQDRVAYLNSAYRASREWLIHSWEPPLEHAPAF